MKLSQSVYFALSSETVTAAEITARLGVEPDEILVRGSRDAVRVVPRVHEWSVLARHTHKPVDEQVTEVVDRLAALADRIGSMVGEIPVRARLQVVRNFDDPSGDEDEGTPAGLAARGLEKLEGQHHLLGWHLDRGVLSFLEKTRAELDVDEYG